MDNTSSWLKHNRGGFVLMGVHITAAAKVALTFTLGKMRVCRECGERYPLTVFSCEHCGNSDYAIVTENPYIVQRAA